MMLYINKREDIDHKSFKMEKLICPKCKYGNIHEQINYGGFIFFRKKRITYYCDICDWENKKAFLISEKEYQEKTI